MLHAIAPNRGAGYRVAVTPPEVHAAQCEGGHRLSVMAVTKRRFWADAPNSLPRADLVRSRRTAASPRLVCEHSRIEVVKLGPVTGRA